MEIITLKEEARGCGYRHSGKDGVGLYLMGYGFFEVCERLPFPIGVCPCCGQGTKFSRGFTWIEPSKLFDPSLDPQCDIQPNGQGWVPEPRTKNHRHDVCLMCMPPVAGKHGLMWVGEKFYTPASFLQEAVGRGISKRIPSIPRDLKIGETVIYLAHKKAIPTEGESLPAVFTVFRPTRIDIVVDTTNPDELPARAKSIAARLKDKAQIVKIEPMYKQQSFIKEEE
jgi:hypothetical protein